MKSVRVSLFNKNNTALFDDDLHGKLYLDSVNEYYVGYCNIRRMRVVIRWSDLMDHYLLHQTYYGFVNSVMSTNILKVCCMGGVWIPIGEFMKNTILSDFHNRMKDLYG